MLILRHLPDPKRLAPLPANEAYRRSFYAQWGRENCIVLATTRRAEYPPFTQRLSIKVAHGGRERYFLANPSRTVAVDDDNFLILNDGRTYGSLIESEREIETFSIFFRPGLVDEVIQAVGTPIERLLESPMANATDDVEFMESLQPHDRVVSPVLKYIRHHLRLGHNDHAWYDEQLHFLLERMIAHRGQLVRHVHVASALKRSTRAEIYRRVMLATDYIHARFEEDIDLDVLASVACLSKYHFLRLFSEIHGLTPHSYLQRKRARVANRLIATTSLTIDEIAVQVGYAARSSLFRQIRRWTGCSPSRFRHESAAHARGTAENLAGGSQ